MGRVMRCCTFSNIATQLAAFVLACFVYAVPAYAQPDPPLFSDIAVIPSSPLVGNEVRISFAVSDDSQFDRLDTLNLYYWYPGGDSTTKKDIVVLDGRGVKEGSVFSVRDTLTIPGSNLEQAGAVKFELEIVDGGEGSNPAEVITRSSWDFFTWKDAQGREKDDGPVAHCEDGCLTAFLVQETSNEAPIASFTFTQVDGTLELNFDGAMSSDPDGSIAAWDWDFGDNTTGTGESIAHIFPAEGTYTVTLTVAVDKPPCKTSASPCTRSCPRTWKSPVGVYVNQSPSASCKPSLQVARLREPVNTQRVAMSSVPDVVGQHVPASSTACPLGSQSYRTAALGPESYRTHLPPLKAPTPSRVDRHRRDRRPNVLLNKCQRHGPSPVGDST